MLTELAAIASAAALALAGWAIKEVSKIAPLSETVYHIRGRVDALYDHIIEHKSGPDKG